MARTQSRRDLAIRLVFAVKRIHARLRDSWPSSAQVLPTTQLAILKRLREDGPMTAATLAAAEHVTHQAIAQHLAALREERLVRTSPDPDDGRKALVRITAAGERLFDEVAEARTAWLVRALGSDGVDADEAAMASAIGLLERLAAVEEGER